MNATAPSRSAASTARVTPNLTHAFGGIWRLTLRRYLLPSHWLILVALCVLLVLTSLPSGSTTAAAKIGLVPWIITFYLNFIIPILAFITGAGAIRDEMKAGNVDYVFTRPISRSAFLGFKFLSHLACVQFDFLISFATVLGVAAYREVPMGDHIAALLTAQFLLVTAFTAFGFAAGIATSRYIVVGLVYGAIIEIGVGQIPTQISKISMTHQIHAMLRNHFPVVPDPTAVGATVLDNTSVGATIVLLLGFTAIMLFIAGAVFSFLELSGPNEA